ncbi:MAG: hypothetical protein KBT31_01105 [Firmicutes bacterium]|nr:hypothetical protein [Candidatus Colimorpha enterica]
MRNIGKYADTENYISGLYEGVKRGERAEKALALLDKYGEDTGREMLNKEVREGEKAYEYLSLALSCLDGRERDVVDALFGERTKYAVEDLCLTLGVERATIYRIRMKALKKLSALVTGC